MSLYGEPVTPQLAHDSRAFPSDPPAVLDDPVVVTAHDWAAFRRIERMSNHWDRPGWGPGHRGYYWMLTFPAARKLGAEARVCQAGIADLDLDPVPEDALHVTLNKIGNCQDVAPRVIDDLALIAAGAVGAAFRILAHPLAGSRGAVRFSVTPWTPLVQLYAALATAGQALGAPGGKPIHTFRPHLGVAYSNRECPAGPVVEAVTALRSRAAVPVEVARVDLVELRREGAAYRWRTLHSLPLQAASSPGGPHGGAVGGFRPTTAC